MSPFDLPACAIIFVCVCMVCNLCFIVKFIKNNFSCLETGQKTLRLGAIPSENLPKKSHETRKKPERTVFKRIVNENQENTNKLKDCYRNFEDFQMKIESLKLDGWVYTVVDGSVHFKRNDPLYIIPKYEVIVDETLRFTCVCFGWVLPENSIVYKQFVRTLRKITISSLLTEVCRYKICEGVGIIIDAVKQNIPLHTDLKTMVAGSPNASKTYYRAPTCCILLCIDDDKICNDCKQHIVNIKKKEQRKERQINTPAKPNAPLSQTHRRKIESALKEERNKTNKLNKEIRKMKEQISTMGVEIDPVLSKDFEDVLLQNEKNITPFMKLFWEQQKLARSSNGSIRYHPMMIRFCLSLVSKSAATYDELRSTGVLTLPSRRTLRDYKNAIKPSAGFNHKVVNELIKLTKDYNTYQRYIVISFDEVKIQENLVFDKYSGELVGYVNLGDPELNYSCFDDINHLATHILVFYIRGMASKIKFAFSYFATEGVKSYQLMPIFWEAVAILEFP